MIIKGKSRPAAGTLARYIVQKKENERVSVQEVRGTLSQDVKGALREMEVISEGTSCKSFLYHASINPQEHEHLSPEQWVRAADILEKELKLEGHQRVLVEHVKDGRAHYHCVWNRIDQDTLKAVHMSGSYAAHERAARQMEREFGLERVQGVHAERDQGDVSARGPKAWEMERGKRTGVDPRKFGEEIKELWNQAENGEAFAVALEARGYVLAEGDRRNFVVIDGQGDPHSLARRAGVRAADVRAKMAGFDREGLPTVDQAHGLQQELAAKVAAQRQQDETEARRREDRGREQSAAHMGATLYDRPDMVSMNRDAMRDFEERNRLKQIEQERAAQLVRQQQEEEKKRQTLALKQKKQEREKKTVQEREEQSKRQKEQEKQRPQEARRDQAQEKREERRARTEQTEAKQRQAQKNAMRELFERRFGKGHNAKDREDWERERER